MAIKTNILSTVNGFITAIITQLKVRNAFSTIVDNIYPTVVYDIQSTTTIFTKVGDDFIYDIKTSKIGRNINICGSFENVTDDSISNQSLVSITNTEFRAEPLVLHHYIPAISISGQIIFLSVDSSGNTLEIIGAIPSNMRFYFNGTYTSKD